MHIKTAVYKLMITPQLLGGTNITPIRIGLLSKEVRSLLGFQIIIFLKTLQNSSITFFGILLSSLLC